MKVLLFLALVFGLYLYGLLHTANAALGQVQRLNAAYEYVANNPNRIAAGNSASASLLQP